jgi:hypothetical protein
MHVDIFTLFPGMFQGPFTESILKRAQDRGLLSISLHNIRDITTDKHHVVDDYPYGGGAGISIRVDRLSYLPRGGVFSTSRLPTNSPRSRVSPYSVVTTKVLMSVSTNIWPLTKFRLAIIYSPVENWRQ